LEEEYMKFARVGAALAAVTIFAAACSSTPSSSGGGGGGGTAIKIGIELPMTGGEAPNGVPTANGVALALSQITVPGFTITVNQQDDAVNGKHDANQGAKNLTTLANDSQVLFVVGPYNSSVAQAEIPVSNAAGLMQCSPANTGVVLTKGDAAVALRKTNPDKIAYVRVATTDDNQGAGTADIAYNTVGAKTAYVLDDTQTYGKGLADGFTDAYTKFGGQVLKRDGVPDSTTDFTSYVTTAQGLKPAIVMYGGVTTSGLGLFRKQMAQAGLASIPMVGGDGINDGSAATASSFLNIAGPDGDANTSSRDPRHPEPRQVRRGLQGEVQRRPGLVQRSGLRVHAGLPAGAQGRRHGRDGSRAAAREGPRLRGRREQEVRHRPRQLRLRRQRRHHPAHDLVLPVRPHVEGLEVPQAARLHRRPGQVTGQRPKAGAPTGRPGLLTSSPGPEHPQRVTHR
jgi:ABC-type branched-subunit amino acid transport system substrate-binding protein